MLVLFIALLSTAAARVPGPDLDGAVADAVLPPPDASAPAARCSEGMTR